MVDGCLWYFLAFRYEEDGSLYLFWDCGFWQPQADSSSLMAPPLSPQHAAWYLLLPRLNTRDHWEESLRNMNTPHFSKCALPLFLQYKVHRMQTFCMHRIPYTADRTKALSALMQVNFLLKTLHINVQVLSKKS